MKPLSVVSSGHDEARRLERLRSMMLLDSEAEPIFDSLATLASQLCGTPIALLSLIDEGRQWFKANVGLAGVSETPREVAFCDHAIRGDDLFEVPDALRDPRFATNPLVTGAPDIRFYAGAPLRMSSGECIGTLCVIDRQARSLTDEQRRTLMHLARVTVQALEMRERSIAQSLAVRSEHDRAVAQSERRWRAILDVQRELVSQSAPDGHLLYVNPAYAGFFGQRVDQLVGTNLYDHVLPEDRESVRRVLGQVLAEGEVLTMENRMVSPTGADRWVSWTNTRQFAEDGSLLMHSTGRDVTARVLAQRALAHSEALLEKTGRAAGVGGWELDLRRRELFWTAETRRIHEVPADFQPTLEGALAFYSPASQPLIQQAVERGMADGTPWDLELELITARGRAIWARAVGEVEFEGGKPVRMFGAFQDITERRAAERTRQQVAAIFDNSTDLILQADRERRVRYMNPAAARTLLGRPWRAEDGPGMRMRDLVPQATQRQFETVIAPALDQRNVWLGQSLAYDARRHEIPVSHMVIAHRDPAGAIERYSILFRDISDLVAAREAGERQARQLRSVTDAIPATVAVVDRDGRYVMVNPAFERAYGLGAADIVGRLPREVLGEREFRAREPWIQRALAGETVRFERELEDGLETRTLSVDYLPLRTASGEPDGFVLVGQDITQSRQEHARLQALSQTDPLTRLLNRAGFEQRMHNALDAAEPEPLALIYLDLDRFKPVNDTHGHAVGDALLRIVARRLLRLVRPSDAVARFGGDEFAIALLGMRDAQQLQRVAQSIVDALGRPFKLDDGLTLHVGASVGGALGRVTLGNWPELLARADAQLYVAKSAGRARVSIAPDENAAAR